MSQLIFTWIRKLAKDMQFIHALFLKQYVCSVSHVNAKSARKFLFCILNYLIGDTILAPKLADVFCVTSRLMYNACRVNTCFYRGLSFYSYPWKHLSQVGSRKPSHQLSSKRYVWYWFSTKCHNTMAVVLTGVSRVTATLMINIVMRI